MCIFLYILFSICSLFLKSIRKTQIIGGFSLICCCAVPRTQNTQSTHLIQCTANVKACVLAWCKGKHAFISFSSVNFSTTDSHTQSFSPTVDFEIARTKQSEKFWWAHICLRKVLLWRICPLNVFTIKRLTPEAESILPLINNYHSDFPHTTPSSHSSFSGLIMQCVPSQRQGLHWQSNHTSDDDLWSRSIESSAMHSPQTCNIRQLINRSAGICIYDHRWWMNHFLTPASENRLCSRSGLCKTSNPDRGVKGREKVDTVVNNEWRRDLQGDSSWGNEKLICIECLQDVFSFCRYYFKWNGSSAHSYLFFLRFSAMK